MSRRGATVSARSEKKRRKKMTPAGARRRGRNDSRADALFSSPSTGEFEMTIPMACPCCQVRRTLDLRSVRNHGMDVRGSAIRA